MRNNPRIDFSKPEAEDGHSYPERVWMILELQGYSLEGFRPRDAGFQNVDIQPYGSKAAALDSDGCADVRESPFETRIYRITCPESGIADFKDFVHDYFAVYGAQQRHDLMNGCRRHRQGLPGRQILTDL